MIKKILKFFLYNIAGKPLYLLIRPFYVPPEIWRRRLRFRGRFRVKTYDGRKFLLYNNAFHLENHIFWLGLDRYSWERMTRRIWTKLCRHSDNILDVGANSGIYALLAKVYNTASLVIAFEPQPNVFQVLCRNNQLNGYDIRCEQLALSDEEGRLPFYNYGPDTFTTENTMGGSLNREWITREMDSIPVEVRKLESYIDENSLEAVDLMKIDVGTLESEVLKGYGRYLKEHCPAIILEIRNREIGRKIETLIPPDIYSIYSIDEKRGMLEIQNLGEEPENQNYLLCPQSKLTLVNEFVNTEVKL